MRLIQGIYARSISISTSSSFGTSKPAPGQVMQIECQFLEEPLEAAKDTLDKRVTVTGSRPIDQTRRPKSLMVNRLEIIEDSEQ